MISQSEIALSMPGQIGEALDCDFDQETTEIVALHPKAKNPESQADAKQGKRRRTKKFLLFLLPASFFLLPALASFGIEIYNRFYRGMQTPFLYLGIALLCFSLFFLVRRKRWMIPVGVAVVFYLAFLGIHQPWQGMDNTNQVYYYRHWSLNSADGRIHLTDPFGYYPPNSGSYITCNFNIKGWLGYLDNQPSLCSAFDAQLRLSMFLNDHETDEGILREFQWNTFKVGRNSLLGEPLDRSALRVAFLEDRSSFLKKFQVKEIYEVYERQVQTEQSRIIESFSRKGDGKLKSFTESSLINLTPKDVFALYNSQGLLKEMPKLGKKSFAFPAHIDISSVADYSLPSQITNFDAVPKTLP